MKLLCYKVYDIGDKFIGWQKYMYS